MRLGYVRVAVKPYPAGYDRPKVQSCLCAGFGSADALCSLQSQPKTSSESSILVEREHRFFEEG